MLAHSDQVIVSEWVDGRPLSQVISDGTPAERDQAASLYLEFLLRGPNRASLLHADPHPGNFRITPDGRLGVLDFGAVNRLPDGMPPAMGEIITHTLAGDEAALGAVLRRAGFIRPGVEVSDTALLRYLTTFIEPLQRETFTFSRGWLRSVSATIQDPRREQFLVGLKFNLPPDYLLIHRVWLGSIGVLCQIGGTVPMRGLVFAHAPGHRRGRRSPAHVSGRHTGHPGVCRVAQSWAALAAALLAFLKSRTFWSDSASTTSATDRKLPSSE